MAIPMVIETTGRSERAYDIYSRLLKDRIILLGTGIDNTTTASICAQLLFLESVDPDKEIYMYINSPGGYVTAGLAIYDTMQYITCPIATLCMGQAASMGAVLLSAGTPGLRYSLPHSTIMVHQPSGGYTGQVTDIEIHTNQSRRLKDILNTLLAKHTGLTKKKMIELTERDNFMPPEEALKLGFIDKILSSRNDLPHTENKK